MEHERFTAAQAISYDDPSGPALLIGDDEARRDQIGRVIVDGGLRLARTSVSDASERLDQQARIALVWLDCASNWPGDALAGRLAHLAEGGTPVIVSIAPDLIDAAVSAWPSAMIQILVDPDALEQTAAVSTALALRAGPARVSDVGRDNAVRLRQLSDEVGRIAASLARLSTGPSAADRTMAAPSQFGAVPTIDGEQVRAIIRARRLRARYFDEALFADPAWDMLLDLLQAEIAQHRVPVSSLCIAAAVPATTALRWIKTMTDAGLFVRRADPHDGRRIFVELSGEASSALRRYFAEAGDAAGL